MDSKLIYGARQDALPNAIIQDDLINWSSLHDTVANGDNVKLQKLLDGNIDRNTKESIHGNTPLHEAAWRGYSRCVKLLCTPPHVKPEHKTLKGVALETREALHTSILGIQNNGGFSALHLAAQNGHNQSCRELLLAGADPDVQNYYGDTALHTACRYGHAGATRILLSASCDSNKRNLNGDSPLHITCAMGKRKLTRILLEADCDKTLKNAQNETARDIAIRKSYSEVLDIINNPQRMRNKREKHKPNRRIPDKSGLLTSHNVDCVNGVNWSPYGCHYFPDPLTFPSPKLETLPEEPLRKGEQYYLDLAGHIRKGPIGIGNVCYCGPLFRHIEDKLNSNRKSLRVYVHKAKESFGNKVHALAIRTNEKIEQLTRSMNADRIRYESGRIHLDHWLKRDDPLRFTTEQKRKQHNPDGTLTRCRSLELVDVEKSPGGKLLNSKSCCLLQDTTKTLYQEEIMENDDYDHNRASSLTSAISLDSLTGRLNGLEMESYDLPARPEKLLPKTNPTLKIKMISKEKHSLDLTTSTGNNYKYCRHFDISKPFEEINCPTRVRNKNICSKNTITPTKKNINSEPVWFNQNYKITSSSENIERQQCDYAINKSSDISHNADSSGVSNLSQYSFGKHNEESVDLQSGSQYQYPFDSENNVCTPQNVASALRRDHQRVRAYIEPKELNEPENIQEHHLSYPDDKTGFNEKRFILEDSAADGIRVHNSPKSTKKKEQLTKPGPELTSQTQKEFEKLYHQFEPISKKSIEVKNSEIKSLKKSMNSDISKKNKVQEFVALLQSNISSLQMPTDQKRENKVETSDSESSDDERNFHHEDYRSRKDNYSLQLQSICMGKKSATIAEQKMPQSFQETLTKCYASPINKMSYDINNQSTFRQQVPEHIIPRDAYFHDLPNKNINKNVPNNNNNASLEANILRTVSIGTNVQHTQYYPHQTHLIANANSPIEPIRFATQPSNNYPIHNTILPTTLKPNQHLPSSSVNEKLLSNRKFHPPAIVSYDASGISCDYELVNMECFKEIQPIQQSGKYFHICPEERDISNDSGFSNQTCGRSYRPSPRCSLKKHPAYTPMQSPTSMVYSANSVALARMEACDNFQLSPGRSSVNGSLQDVEFNVGNVSSLV